jgi:hypothetical protein
LQHDSETNKSVFSFNTGGGTQHITRRLAKVARDEPPRQIAPSSKGVVGVTADSLGRGHHHPGGSPTVCPIGSEIVFCRT